MRPQVKDLSPLAQVAAGFRDRLGRKQLSKPWAGLAGVLSMIDWGVGITNVPGEYWALEDVTAVVACPCGEAPEAIVLETPVECACGRAFFFDGADVWVLGKPKTEQPEDPQSD